MPTRSFGAASSAIEVSELPDFPDPGRPGGGVERADWERIYAYCDEVLRTSFLFRALQEADREDCRQEIYLELFLTRLSIFRGGNFRGWLLRVARNKAIDVARRRGRNPVGLPVDPSAAADPETGRGPSVDESRSTVWSALAELEREVDPRNFLVFFLRWIEGWSFRDIANVLSLTPAQTRLRHHRTKEKFRRCIVFA